MKKFTFLLGEQSLLRATTAIENAWLIFRRAEKSVAKDSENAEVSFFASQACGCHKLLKFFFQFWILYIFYLLVESSWFSQNNSKRPWLNVAKIFGEMFGGVDNVQTVCYFSPHM